MKKGDTVPVMLANFHVANAVITEIEDGKAYLTIPATNVTMGVATSLTDLEERTPEVERTLGTYTEDQTNNVDEESAAIVEEPQKAPETAEAAQTSGSEERVPLKDREFDTSAIDR